MNNRDTAPGRIARTRGRFFSDTHNAVRAGVVALVLLLGGPARAADVDARYLEIYNLIEQADALNAKGPAPEAKARYQAAEKALKELKQVYPTYNPKLVAARLNYLANKITALSQPATVVTAHEPSAATLAEKAVVPGQPQIRLLETGAEPRKAFRLQARAAETQKIRVVVSIKMGLVAPEMPSEMMAMPAMTLAAAVTTKTVNPEGEAAFEVVIDEVGVAKVPGASAEVMEEMKKQFGDMKGLVVAGTMTDRYLCKNLKAQIPPGTDAETRESMEQMGKAFANTEFVLPEEAIGVGAKWEVKQKTKDEGMTIDETIRHELVSLEGEVLVVKSTTTQTAANQKIPNPIMPTVKVDMTKMTGTATEITTINLGKLLPVKATADERTEVIMSATNGGKKQAFSMKTETHSTMESE